MAISWHNIILHILCFEHLKFYFMDPVSRECNVKQYALMELLLCFSNGEIMKL